MRRLTTFLDAAFDEQVATNPQLLTSARQQASSTTGSTIIPTPIASGSWRCSERQLAEMRAPVRSGPAQPGRAALLPPVREGGRGRPRRLPLALARLPGDQQWQPDGQHPGLPDQQSPGRQRRRRRGLCRAAARRRAGDGRDRRQHAPPGRASASSRPRFNFAPVREDGRRILAGAPFADGADSAVFADFKAKVGRLEIPQAEKDRLIAAAREALTGPFRRGYEAMLATLDAIEPRATRQPRRLEPAGRRGLLRPAPAPIDDHRPHRRADPPASASPRSRRIHGEMERIKRQVGFTGTLQQFFAHINERPGIQISEHRRGPAAISRRRPRASSPR